MKLTKVYKRNAEAWLSNARLIANKGGTRSGKTYSLISFFVSLCITNKSKRVIDVVSESMPHLKRGALNDMEEILINENLIEGIHYEYNRSDRVFSFKGGSVMRFYSADDWGKVKGPGRDILFINECNRIPYEVYRQLAVRTRQTIFLDWNPDSEFWYEQKGLNIKKNTVEIHSTYKDNPFLSEVQIAEIESNKDDENWWKVYGLGQVGRPQGVIFTRWQQCRDVPEGAKLIGRGLDFGFSCFKGDTLIATDKGFKPIKDIVAGDFVLTRQGYKKVIKRLNNGIKEVIRKDFHIGGEVRTLYATYSHNINTNGKWKQYGKLQKADKLCILSNLKGEFINDTRQGSTQTIFTQNGKKKGYIIAKDCIMQYMRSTRVKSLTEKLYTTLTEIRSITTLKTYWRSLRQNIQEYIGRLLNTPESTVLNLRTQKRIGRREEKKLSRICKHTKGFVSGVVQNTLQQMSIKDFAVKNVTIDGSIKHQRITRIGFANGAEECLREINTSSPKHAQMNALISYQEITSLETKGAERVEVYDLWVEDVHEYFANGILVHNCDPTTIIDVYLHDGKLWLDERCWQVGMTNDMIASELRGLPGWTVADCAEPKSIQEIRNYGIRNIEPSVKGADSIRAGIQIMQRYEIMITQRSLNLIKEFRNYKWKEDKITGELLNEPIDKYNHCVDAARYVCLSKLSEKPTIKRPTVKMKRR